MRGRAADTAQMNLNRSIWRREAERNGGVVECYMQISRLYPIQTCAHRKTMAPAGMIHRILLHVRRAGFPLE
jgi:hypothetical protein